MNKSSVASKTRKQLRTDFKEALSGLRPAKNGIAFSKANDSREDRGITK